MIRRVPLGALIIVLAAAATMIALGFWQLERRAEKEALLAQYGRAVALSSDVAWPPTPEDVPGALYRRTRIDCLDVRGIEAVAGRSHDGRKGWAHVAQCQLAHGQEAVVALGWSEQPVSPSWPGGVVTGFIGPAGGGAARLVASPAQAGLVELAKPDPKNIPNNHLSYAVQWFAFAATALVIFGLALRSRVSDR